MISLTVEEEFRWRVKREQQKALIKYGDDCQQAVGNLEIDALDHLINEMIGLLRYGEILRARGINCWNNNREAIVISRLIIKVAHHLTRHLIQLRQNLLAQGYDLGRSENE